MSAPTATHMDCVDDGVEFGEEYYRRLCALLRSDEAEAGERVEEMLAKVRRPRLPLR